MKKREVKRVSTVFVFSIILVLSLSLVSADFISFLRGVFTGKITGDPGACSDTDGGINFHASGYVSEGGTNYPDNCTGNIAWDYYCPGASVIDPVDDKSAGTTAAVISGNEIGTPDSFGGENTGPAPTIPDKALRDCQTSYNPPRQCVSGGICGCTQGAQVACDTGLSGSCGTGKQTCSDNAWSSCIATQSSQEVCDGVDNNCDGKVDENTCTIAGETCQNLGAAGWACAQGPALSSCTDVDGDKYSKETNPSQCGNNCNGQACLGGNDCNDNNASINPGKTEICNDGVDNNCDGKKDCADASCSGTQSCLSCTPGTCSSLNASCGTIDNGCGTNLNCGSCSTDETCLSNQCIPTCIPTTEVCNGKDDNCNGQIDEGLTSVCGDTSEGACNQVLKQCQNGVWQTCDAISGYVGPQTEVCGDGIDNNCDGTIDEGCSGCTDGETVVCGSGCSIGTQSCVSGTWSSDCIPDDPTACSQLNNTDDCGGMTLATCGSNVGECLIGVKYCGPDGKWGECQNAVNPTAEICGDGKDNNCDGNIDENCGDNTSTNIISRSTDTTTSSSSTTDQNTNTETKKDTRNFFEKLIDFFLAMFRVGRVIISGKITTNTAEIYCSDPDGGVNYFVKGIGSGEKNGQEVWFQDTCYKNSIANKQDKCSGADCYLGEYFCNADKKTFSIQLKVPCQYGCSNGACIPGTEKSSKNCDPYFDSKIFDWVNPCE